MPPSGVRDVIKARVMNSKEVKEMQAVMKEQFGTLISGTLYIGSKDRVYLGTPETLEIDFKKVNAEGVGVYIGRLNPQGYRPSIEGAQLLQAKKNVFEISKEQLAEWIRGFNLTIETDFEGFCILTHKSEVLGPGKIAAKKVWNYVPKERRIRRL